jgi:hypothetical protein
VSIDSTLRGARPTIVRLPTVSKTERLSPRLNSPEAPGPSAVFQRWAGLSWQTRWQEATCPQYLTLLHTPFGTLAFHAGLTIMLEQLGATRISCSHAAGLYWLSQHQPWIDAASQWFRADKPGALWRALDPGWARLADALAGQEPALCE